MDTDMCDLKYKGFSYETIRRPPKNGKKIKIEVIRWDTGYRNLWTRISYEDFLKVKKEKEDATTS
jgi:hypothetical protein